MIDNNNISPLLPLLRLGIGHCAETLPGAVDWKALKALAYRQGLSAVIWDGYKAAMGKQKILPGSGSEPAAEVADSNAAPSLPPMPAELEKSWEEDVAKNYEARYADYAKRIGQLAWFYNRHGYKLMIIKGFGLSLNYPNPSHRPCGDIDIWAFGKHKEADEALSKEFGIKIDNSHHHHTVFSFMGYMVENHYDLINVHAHSSSAAMEKIFKELAEDDSNQILIGGEKAYLPSPDMHALFLLRHSMSHFAAVSMNLRQLLDWAFFAKANSQEINWNWLQGVLERFHMTDFFTCINYICVHHLGFAEEIFPPINPNLLSGQDLPQLADRILADMISPEFSENEPRGLFPRVFFKYRRWRANAWKNRLCYKEGLFSSFLVSAWAHLLKPRSI